MAGLNQEMRIPKTVKLFINGEFPRTESGRSFPVHRTKDKSLYAHVCLASRKDFRNSVSAAREAQKGWSGKTAYNRSQILYRMAEMAEAKRAEFLEILSDTAGLKAQDATKAFEEMLDAFVYYAGFADKYQQVIGAVNPVAGPHHNFTTPEPMGVIGYAADEKFSLGRLAAAIAAVICSGNAIVAIMQRKGSAILAPLAEVFATSDLPKGVVNLLSGDLSELAPHFGSHMELQGLCYDGGDEKLRAEIRKAAVENMKRVAPGLRPELCLENILSFVEYKTVWHPIGS
jgi:acyl-CoA reductase-like NAD-dependent aldehyde dehydrogenase